VVDRSAGRRPSSRPSRCHRSKVVRILPITIRASDRRTKAWTLHAAASNVSVIARKLPGIDRLLQTVARRARGTCFVPMTPLCNRPSSSSTRHLLEQDFEEPLVNGRSVRRGATRAQWSSAYAMCLCGSSWRAMAPLAPANRFLHTAAWRGPHQSPRRESGLIAEGAN
jgi:hypothetical protein